MDSYSVYPQRSLPSRTPPAILQGLAAVLGGIALFFVLLFGTVFGFQVAYGGQIYPGISVGGVDVSGLPPAEASALLAERLTYSQTGKIYFKEGDKVWVAKPADVGLQLDPQSSALAAYSLGREGNPVSRLLLQLDAWNSGVNLAPSMVFDERTAQNYLVAIAAQVDTPTVEASLSVQGVDVVAVPGQVGRKVDLTATLAPLEAQLRSLSDSLIPVVVQETPPQIMDASAQAAVAKQVLSAPLTIQVPNPEAGDPGPWTIEPQQLASMLVISKADTPQGPQYQVGLNAESMRAFLEGLAPSFTRTPVDARFIFNDDTHQLEVIQNAVVGRSLDVNSTIQAINQKLVAGEHAVDLAIVVTQPQLHDTVTAQELGITTLVAEQTSYFYGSGNSRIQNIKTAAARFHGVMVPPGATFSMATVLGDVSLDTGYAEALIIYGDRTIKGVGGGVCQVSTTLFRTVFFAGYPVVERNPHAYRVGYYELNAAGGYDTNLAGLDATVFVPVVDFKFTNDTPNWLLMETYTNVQARSLTWKFYSTPDGRTVDWSTTGLRNIEHPEEPVYQENPDLGKGEIKQVDWEVDGADVSIHRTVYKGGMVYFEDDFNTHYVPWRAVYEYGPGTKIPKNKNGD